MLDVSIVLDESSYTLITDPDSNETMPSFDGNATLAGKLVVCPPEAREVYQDGIQITFSTLLGARARARSPSPLRARATLSPPPVRPHSADKGMGGDRVTAMEKKWQLLEPGVVSEPIEIPFDIDLFKLINLRESYTGTNFSVTHAIGYYIARPWYTFPVSGEQQIHVRKGVPATEVLRVPSGASRLEVADFGGRCDFHHTTSTFPLDGNLVGEIVFSEMEGAPPIREAALLLGKTEFWGDECADSIVRYWYVHKPSDTPITGELKMAVDVPFGKQADEPPSDAPFQPSIPKMTPDDPGCDPAAAKFEVLYWLRLLVAADREPGAKGDDKPQWWTTHPVTLIGNESRNA